MSEKLLTMARSKLHVQPGARDSVSLHRWVLLKNSIVSSPPATPSSPVSADDDTDDPEETDTDAFMFPDAGKLVSNPINTEVSTSEAQWLDSLLQTLGGDEEDEDFPVESNIALPIEDEDDDQLFTSPVGSPIASSDDLTQSACYPHLISVPYSSYPLPYATFHPPLIYPYQFGPESSFSSVSSFSSHPPPFDDPLPYYDYDIETSSVPDAIEDTSDDDSDVLTTPSLGRSSLLDPTSPLERSRLRHPRPYVHVEPNDPYFYPFELDPLPFPNEHQPYNTNNYQEC